jgi:AraC-like DNA-binding protein
LLENEPDVSFDLVDLAQAAGLSKFHFLRTFVRVTGATPHQYVLRARLRRAAVELQTRQAKVVEVAFGCGFGDVSSFNRAFRAEFGVSPRAYRSMA